MEKRFAWKGCLPHWHSKDEQVALSATEAALTAGAEAEAELVLEAKSLMGPQVVITSYVGPVIIRD